MSENLARLRQKMASSSLPALLVTDIENVRWLTGFTGSYAMALVTADRGLFVSDGRYDQQAKKEVSGLEVGIFVRPATGEQLLKQFAQSAGLSKVGFETSMAYASWRGLSDQLAPLELTPAPDILGSLRLVKSADEVRLIQDACALADECLRHVQRLLQPGVSEFDIGLEIEFFFRRHGAQIGFDPIVASGWRSALPHGRASEKKLESGDFVTLDLGACLGGYCSDITRTFVLSEASDRHRKVYQAVLEAQVACVEALRPGANGKDLFDLAKQILGRYDLADYFTHGLGHGLGRVVHDGGRLGSGFDQPIEPGQVWTIEPGVYIEGFGGVRIEDDVLVTQGDPHVLTHFPKELMILS